MSDDLPWITETVPEETWRQRLSAHQETFSLFFSEQVHRRSQGRKNPTLDFLFEYYGFPPAQFLRWSPGFGVLLTGSGVKRFLTNQRFVECERGVTLSIEKLAGRRDSLRWILKLLEACRDRPPFYGCFGKHEWALIHHSKLIHPGFDLRVAREGIAGYLESTALRCSHYDAFRFFSNEAQGLNDQRLTDQGIIDQEQPGCLHTNMDLYRWAYKLSPWVSSELLARAFTLAHEARVIDSGSSPYDLTATGVQPLPIETEAGRQAFVTSQQRIHEKARPIRADLIAAYRRVLDWLDDPGE